MSRTMAMKWLSVLLLLGAFLGAHAQTINAATCNATDVQKAFNSVTASTTTVNIPAGTCNWTSQVTLTIPSGNTSLSVFGAGSLTTVGGGDATVFVDNDTTDSNYLLQINTNSTTSAYVRIAGFTIQNGSGVAKNNGALAINGESHNFRADHFHLNGSTGSATTSNLMRFGGWVYGVVDHSQHDGAIGIEVYYGDYNNNNDAAGYASWNDSDNFGTSGAIYIENNVFNSTPGAVGYITDCSAGGRFVVRFNTINYAGILVHPTGGSGNFRGCRTEEVYENTFNSSNSNQTYTVFWDSSGTAMFWDNCAATSCGATVGFQNFIVLESMRINGNVYAQSAPPNGWGYCGTAYNGTGSAWDQNSNTTTGYRCLDEPGTGKSDLLVNWFPYTCDETLGQCGSNPSNPPQSGANYNGVFPNQVASPIYEWLDTYTPASGYASPIFGNSSAPQLSANVDWYQYNASFTGTSGVGSGTLASRPSTCTTGVGYWATDQGNWNQSGSGGQGILYVCTATNTWTQYYEPYTYPHPLTQGDPPPPPAPPTGLNATVQ